MDRRRMLGHVVGAGLAGHAAGSRAQPAGKPLRRIGRLSFGTAPSGSQPDPDIAFRDKLRALGDVDGRDLIIESRDANGQPERFAALAAELVQMKLDLIDAGGSAATLAVTFPERGAKGLELLKEAVPGLSRMALLWAPTDLGRGGRPDELRCRSRCTRAARGRLCGQELPQASPLRADRVIA